MINILTCLVVIILMLKKNTYFIIITLDLLLLYIYISIVYFYRCLDYVDITISEFVDIIKNKYIVIDTIYILELLEELLIGYMEYYMQDYMRTIINMLNRIKIPIYIYSNFMFKHNNDEYVTFCLKQYYYSDITVRPKLIKHLHVNNLSYIKATTFDNLLTLTLEYSDDFCSGSTIYINDLPKLQVFNIYKPKKDDSDKILVVKFENVPNLILVHTNIKGLNVINNNRKYIKYIQ